MQCTKRLGYEDPLGYTGSSEKSVSQWSGGRGTWEPLHHRFVNEVNSCMNSRGLPFLFFRRLNFSIGVSPSCASPTSDKNTYTSMHLCRNPSILY